MRTRAQTVAAASGAVRKGDRIDDLPVEILEPRAEGDFPLA